MEKNLTGIKISSTAAKAPAATKTAEKGIIKNKLEAAAKTTDSVCADIVKKILENKAVSAPEVTEVGGVNKAEMIKLIELLDAMGSKTYSTACALRDLHQRMK